VIPDSSSVRETHRLYNVGIGIHLSVYPYGRKNRQNYRITRCTRLSAVTSPRMAPRALNKQWCLPQIRHINRIESDADRRAAHPGRWAMRVDKKCTCLCPMSNIIPSHTVLRNRRRRLSPPAAAGRKPTHDGVDVIRSRAEASQ